MILLGKSIESLILDNCDKDGKELICKVNKNNLEQISTENNAILRLMSYFTLADEQTVMNYKTVNDIIINYNNVQK